MKKFEYTQITLTNPTFDEILTTLNHTGEQGWELVQLLPARNNGTTLLLKREVQNGTFKT